MSAVTSAQWEAAIDLNAEGWEAVTP